MEIDCLTNVQWGVKSLVKKGKHKTKNIVYSRFNMGNKFSAYWLFYALGLVFWMLSMNMNDSTMLCVFYSTFVGTVWGLVPQFSGSEPLSWKHLLPPFMLVVLMMLSVRLKMVMSTDVVLITAMSLIHFRASVFSFSRLAKRALAFSWIQLLSFLFGLAFLFQKNITSIVISRGAFLKIMMGMSTLSIAILLVSKRKSNGQSSGEINHESVSS